MIFHICLSVLPRPPGRLFLRFRILRNNAPVVVQAAAGSDLSIGQRSRSNGVTSLLARTLRGATGAAEREAGKAMRNRNCGNIRPHPGTPGAASANKAGHQGHLVSSRRPKGGLEKQHIGGFAGPGVGAAVMDCHGGRATTAAVEQGASLMQAARAAIIVELAWRKPERLEKLGGFECALDAGEGWIHTTAPEGQWVHGGR